MHIHIGQAGVGCWIHLTSSHITGAPNNAISKLQMVLLQFWTIGKAQKNCQPSCCLWNCLIMLFYLSKISALFGSEGQQSLLEWFCRKMSLIILANVSVQFDKNLSFNCLNEGIWSKTQSSLPLLGKGYKNIS